MTEHILSATFFAYAHFAPSPYGLMASNIAPVASLWDIGTGKAILNLEGHSAHVATVAISPDEKSLPRPAMMALQNYGMHPQAESYLRWAMNRSLLCMFPLVPMERFYMRAGVVFPSPPGILRML